MLSTVALLTSGTFAIAEDEEGLLVASYVGPVVGNAEKDTFGYDPNVPSDLQIRFRTICSLGPFCTDLIVTGAVDKPEGGARTAKYHGTITGNGEKDTFAY
jgi:hypothetical protein